MALLVQEAAAMIFADQILVGRRDMKVELRPRPGHRELGHAQLLGDRAGMRRRRLGAQQSAQTSGIGCGRRIPSSTAVAQPHVRNVDLRRGPTQNHHLVRPIEPIRFARCKSQRNEHRVRLATVAAPVTHMALNAVIRAGIPIVAKQLVQTTSRQLLTRRPLAVLVTQLF
jgi:hypothetical protein